MTTYREAGVDIDAGTEAVESIKEMVASTYQYFPGGVLGDIGGFSGSGRVWGRRVVGASADGVGSKLLIATLLNRHHTVGTDLVAMCVNDLIATGFTPAFFLDYLAQEKQIPARTEIIVGGLVGACHEAEIALLGGEMAELPGFFSGPDVYDLAGFAVGFARGKNELLSGEGIKPGMNIYGLSSSGIHANGFSLVRKLFSIDLEDQKKSRRRLGSFKRRFGHSLGDELLIPTRIYVKKIKKLREQYQIRGLVHITGGGLMDNPPRVMPQGCAAQIDLNALKVPSIFQVIQERGKVITHEMLRVFNLGVGMLVITPDKISGLRRIGTIISAGRPGTHFIGGHSLFS